MGGVQTGPAIALSLGNDGRVPLSLVSGTRQVAVEPHPQSATPPPDGLATVAHEVAHGLSLRDEYGERGGRLTIPVIEEKDMAEFGNVQPASILTTSPADQRLDAAKLHAIKWLWPRIAAAGVLKRQPAPGAAGAFQIELEPGHAADFRDRDIVRLRKRPLVSSPTPSPRLRVTGKPDLTTDTVTVKPLDPAAGIAPGGWPAGSVLIRPVRGPKTAQDPNGPDLPLVAPLIVDHLRVTRIPLNRTPAATGQPAPICVRDDHDEQPPQNLPAGLKRPKFKRHVAGLYDGGFGYHCGVLHPTGACLMRALTYTVPKQAPVPYAFCHVCRYVLVDRLDPPMHRVIEADVVKHKQYPSK
jgi:hypothetical protein